MDYQMVLLIGNTTDAPNVQKPEGKTAFADFTLAVSRGHNRETDFSPIRVFGKVAEFAEKIDKGAKLLVEGRIELGRYTPENGQSQRTIRVVAHTVKFV